MNIFSATKQSTGERVTINVVEKMRSMRDGEYCRVRRLRNQGHYVEDYGNMTDILQYIIINDNGNSRKGIFF